MGYLKDLIRESIRSKALATKAKTMKMPKRIQGHAFTYPLNVEKEYSRYITKQVEAWRWDFLDRAIPVLQQMFPQKAHQDAANGMDWDALTESLLDNQKTTWNKDTQQNLVGGVFGFANKTSQANQDQVQSFVQSCIGRSFIPEEAWASGMLTEWASKNHDLIKSISDQYIDKANTIVTKAVSEGLVYSEVRDKIRALDKNMTRTKAELIARDQIGKLNGALTKKRMADAGVDLYEWQTVGDERVRGTPSAGKKGPSAVPSHYAMDGMICRWDDPTVYRDPKDPTKTWKPRTDIMPKAHPGEEICCRCTAIAYMEDLFDETVSDAGAIPVGSDETAPSESKMMTKLKSYPVNDSGGISTSQWFKLQSGTDVVDNLPVKITEEMWAKSKSKTLMFDHVSSTVPALTSSGVEAAMANPSVIRAVKYNGQTFVYDRASHEQIAALRLGGKYRSHMMVLEVKKPAVSIKPIKAPAKIPSPYKPFPKTTATGFKIPKPTVAQKNFPVLNANKVIAQKYGWLASELDPKKLGLGHEPFGWDSKLSNANVSLKGLKAATASVSSSKIVIVTKAPTTSSVVKIMNSPSVIHGKPEAVFLDGKYYVTSGSPKIMAQLLSKGGSTIELSVKNGDAALLTVKKSGLEAQAKTLTSNVAAKKVHVKELTKTTEAVSTKATKEYAAGKLSPLKVSDFVKIKDYDKECAVYESQIKPLFANKTLDINTVKALDAYRGEGYRKWNTALRAGKMSNSMKEATAHMDKYLDNIRLDKNVQLFRGINLKTKFTPEMVGTLHMEKGYLSTTTLPGFAEDWVSGKNNPTVCRILAKKGDNFAPLFSGTKPGNSHALAFNDVESEFVGKHDQALRIRKVYPPGTKPDWADVNYDKRITYVDMEVYNGK